MKADVTVIVVTYRHEDFVDETLTSIDQQDHVAHVILCDDASPDASAERMRVWAQGASVQTSTLFATENRGLTATLNAALDLVETPYYTYISGDDVMYPGRISAQREQMEARPELAFVYSDAKRIDENGARVLPNFCEHASQGQFLADDFTSLLRSNWIPAASVLIRTSHARAIGGYDTNLFFEDHDMWLRLASRAPFMRVDGTLVGFREVATSLGHKRFRDDDLGWQQAKIQIRQKHFGRDGVHDSIIASIVRPWLIYVAECGGSSKDLAPVWWRVARSDHRPLSFVYAALASVGLMGLATRVRSAVRALK